MFIGEVNNVEEYLKASDLSVLMSTNAEGFPNVVLESLACGTPVLANDGGGIRELLINGENGYFISQGDNENLVEKIGYLYNNKKVLKDLGENGSLWVRKQFLINKMIRNLQNIMSNRIARS